MITSLNKYLYYIITISFFYSFNFLSAQSDLNLPTYYVSISESDLSKIYQSPYSDTYYPAKISYDHQEFICELRLRGTSSRTLPKKSWKIKFPNNKNIFSAKKVNFNAEYRDRSIMRNFLTNKLFEFLRQPAPLTSFINLFVNNQYYGVFSQVEELEEDFLKRYNLMVGSIYKARNHQANFAPLIKYENYFSTWDKQVGNSNDYSDLLALLNKLMFYSASEFDSEILNDLDIENIISYFAIEFVIVGFDSFTKNYNLYFEPLTNKIKLFPWDNDATFGNLWDGSFQNSYITNIDGNKDQNWECLKFNVLFQRLMEHQQFRDVFNLKLHEVITTGFDYLQEVIDSTYDLISPDYYQDKQKGFTNKQFDDEKIILKYFLRERKKFLSNKKFFERTRIDEVYISNPFPKQNEMVIIEAKLNNAVDIYLDYVAEYDLLNGGTSFNVRSIKLYDDGSMQDKTAGDLIYGASFVLPNFNKGIIPFAFRINNVHYQANGFSYYGYGPTVTYALNTINNEIDFNNSLIMTKVFNYLEDQFITLKNISDKPIDLTYFHLRGKNKFDDFVFPPAILLNSNEEIIVSTNNKLSNFVNPHINSLEFLSFKVKQLDTIKIYSPANTILYAKEIDEITELELVTEKVVINEINYNSNDSLITEDWVEFYNCTDKAIFLGGWKFRDSNDDNEYIFPQSAIIKPFDYFVLCRDVNLFKGIHPTIQAMGNFSFGLSNSGEKLRLYDKNNILVSSVNYSDNFPWPKEADGKGYTLELINYNFETNNSESWSASQILGGTPGSQNSNFITHLNTTINEIPQIIELYQNYPNPFNSSTKIAYSVNSNTFNYQTNVILEIYDVLGNKISEIVNENQKPGKYEVQFYGLNLVSGVYYYRISISNTSITKKMILLK